MTGSGYKIQIKESKFGPEDIAIKLYKVNCKTHKFERNPTITIYTNVTKFAQTLLDHYQELPFKRKKGEPVE